jgi:hypothetical protein
MISDNLSLVSAILAFPSVAVVGLVLLTESWGNLGVRLPQCSVKIRSKMAENPGKWNAREFYMRLWGFIGALVAILLQIAAVSIRIWG